MQTKIKINGKKLISDFATIITGISAAPIISEKKITTNKVKTKIVEVSNMLEN